MAAVIDINEVIKQVNQRVLATPGVYQTASSNTERYPAGEVSDAALDADAIVASWFLQRAGDGRRVPFLLTATVAHGGQIPSHIGEIEAILLNNKVPILGDPVTIERDRSAFFAAKGTVRYVPKIYIMGSTLSHNYTGGGATVIYADYTRTGACQCPGELAAPVIALATAMVIGKLGNHSDAVQAYQALGMAYMGPVMKGEALAPLPTPGQIGAVA